MTQYSPPHMSDYVERHRLFHLIDENIGRQTFVITGQAAQGKTTLIASYLKQSHDPTLWFHLSPDDGDHAKLFDKLVAGIHHHQLSAHKDRVQKRFIPHSTLWTKEGLTGYMEGLTQLLLELRSGVNIVLDDLESLDDRTSGFQLIQHLIRNRFSRIKFFLLSRRLPPLNTHRLKMEQDIFMLGNEDLAFTLDETRLFFLKKISADSLDIERIYKITNGWAGGLTLVSESIRQFRQMKNLPDCLSSEVFNYFSQEIYENLPGPIQDFLMKTAVFDIIDLEMIHHIFEPYDASEILIELEKRNLFIQRIDVSPPWPKFKYNNLFRDFLIQYQLRTKGHENFKILNRKAGHYYRDRHHDEQAMNCFVRADAFPDIIRIIKNKGTDYIINGKMSRLEKWISHLPDTMIQADPWLIFFCTMTQRIKGGKKNISNFKKALALFEQNHDMRGILLSIGYLIEAAVFIRQPSAIILEWIEKGEAQLMANPHKNQFAWARTLLWQQIGLGYIAGNGDIPKGVSACQNAVLLGKQIHNSDLVLNASITMAFGYVQAGDFENAQQMLLKIKNITTKSHHPEYRALKSIVDIDFALKNGRFDAVRELLRQSETDIEKFGLIFLYPGFVEAKTQYLIYTGQYDPARQMADHLNDFSILEGNDFYKGISLRLKAMSFLQEKKFNQAATEIKKALTALDQARKGDIHHFLAQQMAGIIFFHNKEWTSARKMLLPALDYFGKISSDLCYTETCFVLGLISWELKQYKPAFEYFNAGFEKVFQEGYVFFPLISHPILIRVILLSTAHQKNKRVETCLFPLILKHDSSQVSREMERVLSSDSPEQKQKRVENLKPLYNRFLPKIRISTLGQFCIYADDVKLDPKLFEGARPILLLKSIVLHGARDIPKEILIDDLWPDATAGAGDKNFKINLHRLRKALEPSPQKEFGYSYIVQKAGLISFDPDLVSLDVDEFISFGAMAVEYERNNQFEQALQFYETATNLYHGDYFAEEPYLEWISRKRDLFKARFIELMQKKAMLHEEMDQIENAVTAWRRILEADPCFEIAYQNLMILYADSGQKNKALDIFRECESILKQDLAIEPDTQTRRIYNEIKLRLPGQPSP